MTGSRWLFNHHASNNDKLNLIERGETEIVKQNPIFSEEEEEDVRFASVKVNDKTLLNLSWNPDYVVNIAIKGVNYRVLNSEVDNDRSLTCLRVNNHLEQLISNNDRSTIDLQNDNQSQSSSDIDEDLFNMDVPVPLQPMFNTRSSYLNLNPANLSSDKMIQDFSERLASSRERNLLTSTIEKSERYNSIRGDFDFFQAPSTSSHLYTSPVDLPSYKYPIELKEIDNVEDSNVVRESKPDVMMLPVLKELDRILSSSRTLNTFKIKVHRVKEQIQDSSQTPILQMMHTDQTRASCCKLIPDFIRRQRYTRVIMAVLLLVLFLAMLVSLSVCCSNRKTPD